jgi:hypothetical protein
MTDGERIAVVIHVQPAGCTDQQHADHGERERV